VYYESTIEKQHTKKSAENQNSKFKWRWKN